MVVGLCRPHSLVLLEACLTAECGLFQSGSGHCWGPPISYLWNSDNATGEAVVTVKMVTFVTLK